MRDQRFAFTLIIAILFLVPIVGHTASAVSRTQDVTPPDPGRPATTEELDKAWNEWRESAHADTYDEGMGANTTCARCKSPQNWDPQAPAAQESLNCASCKRVPGAPRPTLSAGVEVSQDEWHNIPCKICHISVGDTYGVNIAYWNQAIGAYEPVENENDLCARCHEGQHGFHVGEEQEKSPAHTGWACSRCHGAHGATASCTDCHNPAVGDGARDHALHREVNCTACHDAGNLGIWQDTNPTSQHYGQYITVRFAHTLTSWPSHNLQTSVKCERCHHPRGQHRAAVAPDVACNDCHEDGAVLFWCREFRRDPDPNAQPSR